MTEQRIIWSSNSSQSVISTQSGNIFKSNKFLVNHQVVATFNRPFARQAICQVQFGWFLDRVQKQLGKSNSCWLLLSLLIKRQNLWSRWIGSPRASHSRENELNFSSAKHVTDRCWTDYKIITVVANSSLLCLILGPWSLEILWELSHHWDVTKRKLNLKNL